MKLELILENLIETLKIPIDSVEDLNGKYRLKSYGSYIGDVAYFNVKDQILFETDDRVLNNLKWHLIFNDQRDNIISKIKGFLDDNTEIEVINLNFRRVKVETFDSEIYYFTCSYIQGQWQVIIEDKD